MAARGKKKPMKCGVFRWDWLRIDILNPNGLRPHHLPLQPSSRPPFQIPGVRLPTNGNGKKWYKFFSLSHL
jgi:hypothetical protein